MDMLCPKCGEPIDNDEFHDIAKERGTTYRDLIRAFQSEGCTAIGYTHGDMLSAGNRAVIEATYEMLGDDTDGAMAMLEDAQFMGYLDDDE